MGAAIRAIDRHIATGRVEEVESDFSEAVPPGEDAYLLKWIVHDWDDEAAIRILTNCRTWQWLRLAKCFSSRSLFQKAMLVPMPPACATRLVFTGSRERTEGEYRDLLHRAGLTLGTTPSALRVSILRGPA